MGKKSKKRQTRKSQVRTESRQHVASNGGIRIGDLVRLQGLTSVQFNGKEGSITCMPNDNGGRYGVLLDGASTPVAIRPENVVNLARNCAKSTSELRAQRDTMRSMTELADEDRMNADQLNMMRSMMDMFMTDEMEIKIYGRKITKVPNFVSEVLHEGGNLPRHVDKDWARKYLRLSFEHTSGLPQNFEMVFKSPDYQPTPQDYFKRLGSNDRSKLEWFFGPHTLGDIYRQDETRPYCDFVRHSFSNQAYRQEKFSTGKTHVALGFVDLGILFAASIDTAASEQPLRFVGIELSAYSVAKTRVLWQLFLHTPSKSPDRDVHLHSIAQVWFSATWSQGTADAVKGALATLCSSHTDDSHVNNLLQYWFEASPVPIKTARREIQKETSESFSSIGHLLKKSDRIALAKYELTRDFALSGEPVHGNTLMFDCPDGTSPLIQDESVFSAFNWHDVMQIVNQTPNTTIMDAAKVYAIKNITKIADWATAGVVVVEVRRARFEDSIAFIADQKPWTMSWSNLCDYISYEEFHRIARACSRHGDTVHFGYSMNWSLKVFGTNLIDFQGAEQAETRENLLEATNNSVKLFYSSLGWDKHLRWPPPTNPLNTTAEFGLSQLHFKKWCEYFFQHARDQGTCRVGNVEHAISSPLSKTGGCTAVFTWTYDPDISFRPV